MSDQAAANTDRELWRKGDGDGNGMSYYEPSIHVTERGEIGINVGGTVYVKPVEEWHRAMDWPEAWRFIREEHPGHGEHHPSCSWVQTNGGLLCDCDVLWDEYVRRGGTDPRVAGDPE